MAGDVEVCPSIPVLWTDVEVVNPGICNTRSSALGIVRTVFSKIDFHLETANLSRFNIDFGWSEIGEQIVGTVWNPNIVGILGIVHSPTCSVVEVIPVALPCVTDTVGIDWDRLNRHERGVDVVSVPNGVFGMVHDTVVVLVTHQLECASKRNSLVGIGKAVADSPIVTTTSRAQITIRWDIVACVIIVTCFTRVCHAIVSSGQFEDEFEFMNSRIICRIPVIELSVCC